MEQESASSTVKPPETVRQLQTPAALELADLTAIFEDLTKVAECCEKILTNSGQDSSNSNEILVESLWITALVSYQRCFCAGKSGVELCEQDLKEISLQGDVVQWHNTLGIIRAHYVDSSINPRNSFVVGAAQDSDGNANGIAVTSTPQPQPDATTVRQTGKLALELGQLVERRITTRQEAVYNAARSMGPEKLESLPIIHIAEPEGAERAPTEPPNNKESDQA